MNTLAAPAVALEELTRKLCIRLHFIEAEWHRRSLTCAGEEGLSAEANAFIQEWREALWAELDLIYAQMSPLLAAVPSEARFRINGLYRRLVQPFFMQSPFCRRALDKPLGYPGDYGLVEMIFRGREASATPLGAILGSYALNVGPSEAHRGRLPWAHRCLDAHRQSQQLARPKLLSFACGPEVVLRKWVRAGGEAEILLADHDPQALSWAKRRLERERPQGNSSTVDTVEANAFDLVNGAGIGEVLKGEQDFDVILVLGLLDYLTDAAVVSFLGALAPALKPGGLLLTSNVHSTNPWRSLLELTADWSVAHRSVDQFEGLVGATRILHGARTEVHGSGTNLYCAARAG